jgi:hypothetical protein
MTPDQPGDGEQLFTKSAATFMIPQALLEDMQSFGTDIIDDYLGKALRGEIETRPPVKPPWHRCAFCWLVSLLPGHDRCEHGRLSCDDCFDDYR